MKAGKVYDESEMLELQCSNVQMFVEPVADVGNYCCNVPSTASIQYRMFNETLFNETLNKKACLVSISRR